ncbi:FRG domain-containing protein, partial [Acinetobacter baumannii]
VLTYTKNHIKIFNKFGTRPCLKDILKYYESFNACHLFRGANGAAMHTTDLLNFDDYKYPIED